MHHLLILAFMDAADALKLDNPTLSSVDRRRFFKHAQKWAAAVSTLTAASQVTS